MYYYPLWVGTCRVTHVVDSEREHEDHLFGKLVAKSRRLEIEQVEAGFLKDGFLPEVKKDGVVESFVVNNDNHWSAQQVLYLFLSFFPVVGYIWLTFF